jgi:hypothetical protein
MDKSPTSLWGEDLLLEVKLARPKQRGKLKIRT